MLLDFKISQTVFSKEGFDFQLYYSNPVLCSAVPGTCSFSPCKCLSCIEVLILQKLCRLTEGKLLLKFEWFSSARLYLSTYGNLGLLGTNCGKSHVYAKSTSLILFLTAL